MFQFLAMTQVDCRRSFPRHLRHRITTLAILVVPALVAQVIYAQPVNAKSSDRLNIVLIVADDLGYQELGCFGQKLIRTPNLDQLARQGMRLTQHYSGNAVCAPSRCVLMTGKHPGHAFIRSNKSTSNIFRIELVNSVLIDFLQR